MHRNAALAVLLGLLPLAACGDDPVAPDGPAEVTVSADTLAFTALGQSETLSATVYDASGAALEDASVDWSTADDAVATVDDAGAVEAVGAGKTVAVAAAGAAADTAVVVITQRAASIAVGPDSTRSHALGDTVAFDVTAEDANGHPIPAAAIDWSSSDDAVATVEADGRAVTRSNGGVTISAAVDGVSDEATLVVEQVVASVLVSPPTDTLGQGDSTRLTAIAADSNANAVADPPPVTWSMSDPDAATVDSLGLVTATGWGRGATITATADGVDGTAELWILHQIAFSSRRDGDDEIYLMNADGSDPTPLTDDAANDRSPAFSPDGSQIAFSSDRDGGSNDIFVMDADGSNPVNLTATADTSDGSSTWSPDGTRIAFVSIRDGNGEIRVMDTDGSNRSTLTGDTIYTGDPAWSPDGSRIAFWATAGNIDIYVMDAGGSNLERLTTDGRIDYGPAWSPDGTKIAFASDRDGDNEIYVMDADGSNLVQLTDHSARDRAPAWSPDGTRIAFRSDREGGGEVYVMEADGSNPIRLTNADGLDTSPAWRPVP